MAYPGEQFKEKAGFFHSLSKVPTEAGQYVYESKYKSSHSVKAREIWGDTVPYLATQSEVDDFITNNPGILAKHNLIELKEVPLSNGQAYYLEVGGKWIRPWVAPTDIPHATNNDPSFGLQAQLYDSSNNLITPTQGVWVIDYYAGIIRFEQGSTPADMGWGTPKITCYQYTGGYAVDVVSTDRTYYVDGTNGDDANDGLTLAKAKKTFDFLRNKSLGGYETLPRYLIGDVTINVYGDIRSIGTTSHTVGDVLNIVEGFFGPGTLKIIGEEKTLYSGLNPQNINNDGTTETGKTFIDIQGASFATDELKGCFLQIDGSTERVPIISNTATVIQVPYYRQNINTSSVINVIQYNNIFNELESNPGTKDTTTYATILFSNNSSDITIQNFNIDMSAKGSKHSLRTFTNMSRLYVKNTYLRSQFNIYDSLYTMITYSSVENQAWGWSNFSRSNGHISNVAFFGSNAYGVGIDVGGHLSLKACRFENQNQAIWNSGDGTFDIQSSNYFKNCNEGIVIFNGFVLLNLYWNYPPIRFSNCGICMHLTTNITKSIQNDILSWGTTTGDIKTGETTFETFINMNNQVPIYNAKMGTSVKYYDGINYVPKYTDEYDNTNSGLISTNYQGAIDELNNNTNKNLNIKKNFIEDIVVPHDVPIPITTANLISANRKESDMLINDWDTTYNKRCFIRYVSESKHLIIDDLEFNTLNDMVDWINNNIDNDGTYITETFQLQVYEKISQNVPVVSRMFGFNRFFGALKAGNVNQKTAINLSGSYSHRDELLSTLFNETWNTSFDPADFKIGNPEEKERTIWLATTKPRKTLYGRFRSGRDYHTIIKFDHISNRKAWDVNTNSFIVLDDTTYRGSRWVIEDEKIMYMDNTNNFHMLNLEDEGYYQNYVLKVNNKNASYIFFYKCYKEDEPNLRTVYVKPMGQDSFIINNWDETLYDLQSVKISKNNTEYINSKIINKASITMKNEAHGRLIVYRNQIAQLEMGNFSSDIIYKLRFFDKNNKIFGDFSKQFIGYLSKFSTPSNNLIMGVVNK